MAAEAGRSFAVPVALMFAGVILLLLSLAPWIGSPGGGLEPLTYSATESTMRPYAAAAAALLGLSSIGLGVRSLSKSSR